MNRIVELDNCTLLGVFNDAWVAILYDMTPATVARARAAKKIDKVAHKLPSVVQPGTELAFFLQNTNDDVHTRWKPQGISKAAIVALRRYVSSTRRFVVADEAFLHEIATTPLDEVAAKYGLHVSYLMPLRARVVPKNTYLKRSLRRALTYLRGKPVDFTFDNALLATAVFHDVCKPKTVARRVIKRMLEAGYARRVDHGVYAWVPYHWTS